MTRRRLPIVLSWLLATLLFPAVGCRPTPDRRDPANEWRAVRDDLRRRPGDPELQLRQAWLDLLHRDDRPLARSRFSSLARRRPTDPRASFALTLLAWSEGNYDAMVDAALGVLRGAPSSLEADTALRYLELGFDQVAGFNKRVRPLLTQLLEGTRASSGVRFHAGRLLVRIAAQEKDPKRVNALRRRLGLVSDYTLVGLFGELPGVDLEHPFGPERAPGQREFRVETPLGPRVRRARVERFPDGGVYELAFKKRNGISYATTWLRLAQKTVVRIRIEHYLSLRLLVGGRPVVTHNVYYRYIPAFVDLRVELGPGRVPLQLKLSQPSGWARMFVTREDGRELPTSATMPSVAPSTVAPRVLAVDPLLERVRAAHAKDRLDPEWPLVAWTLHLFSHRFDTEAAKGALATLRRRFPRSLLLRFLGAHTLLRDRSLPKKVAYSRSGTLLRAVIARWPNHLQALFRLGEIAESSGYKREAMRYYRRCVSLDPRFYWGHLRLFYLYNHFGWIREAESTLERLRRRMPFSTVVRIARDFYAKRRSFAKYRAVLEQYRRLTRLVSSDVPLRLALSTGDRGRGMVELQRMIELYPHQLANYHVLLELYLQAAKYREAAALLDRLQARKPGDAQADRNRIRLLFRRDGEKRALAALRELIQRNPNRLRIRQWLARLERRPLSPFKLEDGAAIMADFRKQIARDDAPEWDSYPIVTAFDGYYMRLFDDGSMIYMVHLIKVIQSKKAANKYGEWRPPAGSILLEMRTIKKNGLVVEPERGQKKGDLSFSELNIGDAIEVAYLVFRPRAYHSGGYLSTLIFRTFDNPIYRQDHVIEASTGIKLRLHRHRNPPLPQKVVSTSGSFRGTRYIWRKMWIKPLESEPYQPAAREIYPTVDLFVQFADPALAWRRLLGRVRMQLAVATRPTRELTQTARRLKRSSAEATLRSIFNYVRSRIRQVGRPGSFWPPAATTLAETKGNRVALLVALLEALKIDFELWLTRPIHSPSVDEMPMQEYFWFPVVRVKLGERRYWLDVYQRFAPFGRLAYWMEGAPGVCLRGSCHGRMRFPKMPADQDHWRVDFDLALDNQGSVSGTATIRAFGMTTQNARYALLRASKSTQKRYLAFWLSAICQGSKIDEIKLERLDDPDQELTITTRFRIPQCFGRTGGTLEKERFVAYDVSPLWQQSRSLYTYVRSASRKRPLQVIPFRETLRVTLRLPLGATVSARPASFDLNAPFGHYRQRVSVSGTKLLLERDVTVPFQLIPAASYAAFRGFVQQLYAKVRNPLRLEGVR
ncbi:MAG: hypothetical protein KC609_09835 [Myxococcales bacterium]|nr:hypothetical protein [Myxococcales bacterium]